MKRLIAARSSKLALAEAEAYADVQVGRNTFTVPRLFLYSGEEYPRLRWRFGMCDFDDRRCTLKLLRDQICSLFFSNALRCLTHRTKS